MHCFYYGILNKLKGKRLKPPQPRQQIAKCWIVNKLQGPKVNPHISSQCQKYEGQTFYRTLSSHIYGWGKSFLDSDIENREDLITFLGGGTNPNLFWPGWL